MSSDIYYDDSELQELFRDLEPKMRMKAFRAGFMRAARKVRNRAVLNLRESGIKSNSRLERKIRASMLRRGGAGFKVTKGQTVEVKCMERESENPYLTGKFVIASLEMSAPAQDDVTYSISLENDGQVEYDESALTQSASMAE